MSECRFLPVPYPALEALEPRHWVAVVDLYKRAHALRWRPFKISQRTCQTRWGGAISNTQFWAILSTLEELELVEVVSVPRKGTTIRVFCPTAERRASPGSKAGSDAGRKDQDLVGDTGGPQADGQAGPQAAKKPGSDAGSGQGSPTGSDAGSTPGSKDEDLVGNTAEPQAVTQADAQAAPQAATQAEVQADQRDLRERLDLSTPLPPQAGGPSEDQVQWFLQMLEDQDDRDGIAAWAADATHGSAFVTNVFEIMLRDKKPTKVYDVEQPPKYRGDARLRSLPDSLREAARRFRAIEVPA